MVGEEQKETLKRVDNFLDKGLKSLDKRQKHIKVADRSDYGWATVEHYDSHPLADNSDDEKRLDKAEKEAERAAGKGRCGGGAGTKRRRPWSDIGGPSGRREPQPACNPDSGTTPSSASGQSRPWVLGLCFNCGGIGHLAKTCPKRSLYPLDQPVVSSAEVSHVVAESVLSQGVKSADGTCVNDSKSQAPAFEVAGIQGVKMQIVYVLMTQKARLLPLKLQA